MSRAHVVSSRALSATWIAWLGLLTASCNDSGSSPLQGVVELDERLMSFELAGRIRDLFVERGDRVSRDQRIARLEGDLEEPQRAVRIAEVDSARAQLDLLRAGSRAEDIRATAAQLDAAQRTESLLQKEQKRALLLSEQGVVTAERLDSVNAEVVRAQSERAVLTERLQTMRRGARREEIAAAKARLASAEDALAAATARMSRLEVRSPMAASVLDVHLRPGEVATAGTPIVTLGDEDHPYIDVFVPQERLGGLRVGAVAKVGVDAVRRTFSGKVEHIARQAEFTPRYLFSPRERPNLVVRVRVRVSDSAHQLHAGVPATIDFVRTQSMHAER